MFLLSDDGRVVFHVVKAYAQTIAEDSFTGVKAVFGLLDVVGVRIVVHIVGNLVYAGQWVQYLHVGLGFSQHAVAQNVDILDAFVFHQVGEALFLHAGHVEYVGVGYHLFVKLGVFMVFDAVLVTIELILGGHGKLLGSYEMEDGVEMAHGRNEGVDGASVF